MYWILCILIAGGIIHVSLSQIQNTSNRRSRYAECENLADASYINAYINGRICHVAVADNGRHLCYAHWSLTRQCCERCMGLKTTSIPGCEYGDRATTCERLRSRDCNNPLNQHACCETCSRIPIEDLSGNSGGCTDRSSECHRLRPIDCNSATNRDTCCQTCSRLNIGNEGCIDRRPECRRLRAIDCNSATNRQSCCETCSRINSGRGGNYRECTDSRPECSRLRAVDCNSSQNRVVCCETCSRINSGGEVHTVCTDRSPECSRLRAIDCNSSRNRVVCCETCSRINSGGCTDRSAGCRRLRASDCLTSAHHRNRCCATCTRLIADTGPEWNGDCPHGDNVAQCRGIRTGGCYEARIRRQCCVTCPRLHTGVPGCEYGDRLVFFDTPRGNLDCRNHVQAYGHTACQDVHVARACCQSCRRYRL